MQCRSWLRCLGEMVRTIAVSLTCAYDGPQNGCYLYRLLQVSLFWWWVDAQLSDIHVIVNLNFTTGDPN